MPPRRRTQLDLFAPPVMGDPEAWARERGYATVAGIDEVGRGPLAGPVVAACVVLPADHGIAGLNDSKLLAPNVRVGLARQIRRVARAWAVAAVSAARIDDVNILEATREAMLAALGRVRRSLAVDLVLIDGSSGIATDLPQRALVGGDGLSENIAAASIVAKVARDRTMRSFDRRWPAYGFAEHKGYATELHLAALTVHGPCPIHRMSFRGVLP